METDTASRMHGCGGRQRSGERVEKERGGMGERERGGDLMSNI